VLVVFIGTVLNNVGGGSGVNTTAPSQNATFTSIDGQATNSTTVMPKLVRRQDPSIIGLDESNQYGRSLIVGMWVMMLLVAIGLFSWRRRLLKWT